MDDSERYHYLDWSMDLILVLAEDRRNKGEGKYATWTEILEWIDILDWPKGSFEDILTGALETGHVYEPVMGSFSLVNHDFYLLRSEEPLSFYLLDGILIHEYLDRKAFTGWMAKKREEWDARRGTPNAFITMKIERVPQEIGERILEILHDAGITKGIRTAPVGGI